MMSVAQLAIPVPLYPLQKLFDYRIPPEYLGTVQKGSLVEVTFGRRKTWGVVFNTQLESEMELPKLKFINRPHFEKPVFSEKQLDLLMWLSRYYFYPLGEVCETAIPASIREGSEKLLDPLKYLEGEPNPPIRIPDFQSPFLLNKYQTNAIEAFESPGSTLRFLLFGVTGSGKTEVYLKMIESTLRKGKSALVLVPEIALTPQLTSRFSDRFPGETAIFHSGLSKVESRKSWMNVFLGQRRIAIGARSALFAPLKNLGCIIMDEEHDGSYKQDERLKYHARDAAWNLVGNSDVKLVLGSATPSAETLQMAQKGELQTLKLPNRAIGTSRLPEIEIVDLKQSLPQKNFSIAQDFPSAEPTSEFDAKIAGDFYLSPTLRNSLERTLSERKQSILFLNRRGMGASELCARCGEIASCPDCSIKLTPHFEKLLCHYCGFSTTTPKVCKQCGADEDPFVRVGVGTEAIEKAVEFHFPTARVLRLDRDTATDGNSLFEILSKFKQGEADVLIGTQMVAKGHDFPQVTLVGIISADLGLGVPDFRAFEKNAQLLLQVSGRAGRAEDAGKVILQTFQPEHPVFELVKNYQGIDHYENFILEEISKRTLLNYPPSTNLCCIRFDGFDFELVKECCSLVAKGLNRLVSKNSGLVVLGPVPAPITKLRSKYRWQILLKAPGANTLDKAINWILEGWETQGIGKQHNVRMVLDRDPQSFM
jgi:primosomal protein N' (replication factor Y)